MRDYKASGAYSKTVQVPWCRNGYHLQRYKWCSLSNHGTLAEALADYQQVAIKPGFQWSGRTIGYDIFKRTTALRNDASQRASTTLAIAANHLLSMIDPFATIRLQVQPGENGGTSIGANIGW
jgi:hypothetical protein